MRRRSLFAPLMLVLAGTVLLAANLLPEWSLGATFAEHWPWLLVAWGGIHLLEQALSPAFGWRPPRPLGGGAVVLALLLALAGTAARGARSADFSFARDWDPDWFHEETHSFPVELEVPAGPQGFRLDGLRGEVEIRGDESVSTIAVRGEMLLSGTTRGAVERRSTEALPVLAETEGWTYLTAGDGVGASPGREYRLTVVVPASTTVEASNTAGEFTVTGIDGGLDLEGRGSLRAEEIGGAVSVDLEHGKRVEVHDAAALTLKGSVEHLDLREIRGDVQLDGNLYRDAFIDDLAGELTLLSRSTRLEAKRAPGSIKIQGKRMIVRAVEGMQLEAKGSRRIEILEPIGSTSAFLERGRLIVQPGEKSGAMEIRGLRADVEARIREDASFSIETEAKRGQVRTFLDESEDRAPGAVNGPTLQLESEGGDIEIRPAAASEASERL